MKFADTELAGAYVIDLEPVEDERGFFARTWCARELAEHGLATSVAQCSISFNRTAGTLRGLHFQAAPHEEAKIVRCTRGAIYDVIVDLRPDSPTYLRWLELELTSENRRALYVPEGFAHGFQTLVDETEVSYEISEFYAPDSAQGIRWDDPLLAIHWPEVESRVISAKDRSWPDLVPSPRPGG